MRAVAISIQGAGNPDLEEAIHAPLQVNEPNEMRWANEETRPVT